MKPLHLILTKKWFDLIQSGVKTEEYRDITPHWKKRIIHENGSCFKPFETVIFQHGYAKDAPRFEIECKGIVIGSGKYEWGAAAGKQYFVIKLGKIITEKDREILADYHKEIPF